MDAPLRANLILSTLRPAYVNNEPLFDLQIARSPITQKLERATWITYRYGDDSEQLLWGGRLQHKANVWLPWRRGCITLQMPPASRWFSVLRMASHGLILFQNKWLYHIVFKQANHRKKACAWPCQFFKAVDCSHTFGVLNHCNIRIPVWRQIVCFGHVHPYGSLKHDDNHHWTDLIFVLTVAMVDVSRNICEDEACQRRAYYGFPGEMAIRCASHRLPGKSFLHPTGLDWSCHHWPHNSWH